MKRPHVTTNPLLCNRVMQIAATDPERAVREIREAGYTVGELEIPTPTLDMISKYRRDGAESSARAAEVIHAHRLRNEQSARAMASSLSESPNSPTAGFSETELVEAIMNRTAGLGAVESVELLEERGMAAHAQQFRRENRSAYTAELSASAELARLADASEMTGT